MWLSLVVLITLCFLPFFINDLRGYFDYATRFALLAIWSRYTIGAVSDYTADPLVGPLSPLAIHSFLIILVSPLFMKQQTLTKPFVLQFIPLLCIMLLSSVLNLSFAAVVDRLALLFFLVFVAVLVYQSLKSHGSDKVLNSLLLIHVAPFLFLVADVFVGQPVVAANGASGYYAGYAHNVVISNIIFCSLIIVALKRWQKKFVMFIISLVSLIALNVINYRTTVLGALPVFLSIFFDFFSKTFSKAIGIIVAIIMVASVAALWPILTDMVPDHYAEISDFYNNFGVLAKEPEELYVDELSLFSHRILFWVQGISAWTEGSIVQKLIGFGPGAYESRFGIGAHSGFVTFLFDMGIAGVIALVVLLATQAVISLRIEDGWLALRALACTAGYAILNLAAAPLLSVEGAVAFAILVAATWAYGAEGVDQRAPRGSSRAGAVRIGDKWRTKPTTHEASPSGRSSRKGQRAGVSPMSRSTGGSPGAGRFRGNSRGSRWRPGRSPIDR